MDRSLRIPLVILLLVIASVAGAMVYSTTGGGVDERTLGDLTIRGSIASDGIEADEYAGTATLTYTGSSNVEWRLKDLESTYYVERDGVYEVRGYDDIVSEGPTLKVSDPGRYAVRMYIDGHLARSGTMVLDGDVTKTFAWKQAVSSTVVYEYSVTHTYRFSDYLDRADDPDAVRHTSDSLEDSRFAVVSDVKILQERLLAEYVSVRGTAAFTDGQDYADYLLSFVQCCIRYPDQIAKGSDGEYRLDTGEGNGDLFLYGTTEYWAYPLETIHRGYGDCEDTCFLTAALFAAAGFDSAVATIPDHMVAAVALKDFSPRKVTTGVMLTSKTLTATGTNLFFCETTTSSFLPVGYLGTTSYSEVMKLDRVSMVSSEAS